MSLQLTEIQQIENEFSLKNFNDSFVSKNLVVYWDDFNSKENIKENTVIYEFNTSLKVKNTIENEKQRFDFKYKVLGFKDDSDRWYFELIKIFANNDKALDGISYFSPTDFSGTIYHYNLKGESLALKAYKDGSFLNAFSGKGSKKNNLQSKFPSDDGGSQGDGFWMFSRTKHYTDWYRGNSSGGWSYTHSTYNGSTTEYVWVNTGYTGSGNYHNHGPHGGVEDPTDNHPVEVIVKLTGKAKCVYDLISSSSASFKSAIKQFDGQFPVAHLKFEGSTTLPSDINARTSPPSNFLITIAINENNLSRPNLSIARTLIHETIHAEMYRKILSILDNGGDLDGLTATQWTQKLSDGDYEGIFDYYSRFGVNGMQHEQMAAHYRTTISDMLKEIQPGLAQNIYDSLAWVGLGGTVTWNALTTAEKNAIINTVDAFNSIGAETCN